MLLQNRKLTAAIVAALTSASLIFSGCGGSSPTASSAVSDSSPADTPAADSAASGTAAGRTSSAASDNASSGSEALSSGDSASADAGSGSEDAGDASAPADAGTSAGSDGVSSGKTNADVSSAPEVEGLTCESVMPLDYAECFNVFYYNDGYKVISVNDGRSYLIVPEGGEVPSSLPDDMYAIQQPLKSIYNAASSTMALFDAIDGLGTITMSGTDVSGWDIDAPKEAMESGEMVYAGKYSEPDYEMLIDRGCDLTIESTMILHTPEVQEMIEDLGITVMIDRSAYEAAPLGRAEWVKAYGALLNKEDAAEAFFKDQEKVVDDLADFENTGKSVAYFSINTDGSAVIRTNNDYIPNMIRIAGGVYAFDGSDFADGDTATVTISMEQFYTVARNADYIIYNATIEESLSGVDDLIAKDSLFSDFRAVQDGNVWQIDKKAYQSTDKIAEQITDYHLMLTGGDESQMTFLKKLS